MRSTGFVVLSILVHCMAVAAIGLTPTQTVTNAGEKIEVTMGEAADQPGVPDVPAVPEPSKAQAVAEPTPPTPPAPRPKTVQAAKPAKVAAAPKAKSTATTASTAPVKAAAVPSETGTAAVAVADAAEAPVAAETVPEAKEILMPVKETAPAGVEAATDEEPAATEAKSSDVQKAADPSPVAPVAVATTTDAAAETGALAKGGASKEGAVSYMDLKQMPGNKSPNYPMKARVEKRQGSLELLYRVTKEGKVSDISVAKSSGFKDLDDEAVKAVANFKFVPGQEGWAKHPVSFNLKGTVSTLPSQLRGKGASVD